MAGAPGDYPLNAPVRWGGLTWSEIDPVSSGPQSQLSGARIEAVQDGTGHGPLFALEYPHLLADLVGWSVLLQDAGHPIIQAVVLYPDDGLGADALVVVAHVTPPTPARCSRSVPASTPVRPVPPIPATSLTGMAQAASLSSCGYRYGPVLGRPCRRAQPASASPDRLPVPRTHPAGPARLAAVFLAANPARSVSPSSTALGRSQARE